MSSNADPFAEFGFEEVSVPRPESISSALPKGLLKGLSALRLPFQVRGPIPAQLGEKITEQLLPTQQKLPEQILERTGKLVPLVLSDGESAAMKALQLLLGVGGGQAAKEAGLGETGQDIAELVGISGPDLAKAGTALLKRGVKQTLPSGLTKPKAVEAKFPKAAAITKGRQEKSIKKLNEEASQLAKKSVEEHLPISKQIEEGVDFESRFEEGFGDLKKAAEKANPEIDITPISKLMGDARNKYSGIPKLHPEAMKIAKEVRAFGNRPQTGLNNLLKTYRSNNQKIKHIYETSKLTGRQQEYVKFLEDYNRSIANSFKNTLPENSSWMKRFEDLNKEYRNYKSAQSTLNALRPLLGEQPTLGKLSKVITDPKAQKKLALSMGEEGAKEITQIAKDLKQATESIKKIPVKEMKFYEHVAPLSLFIPGLGKIAGGVFTAAKGVKGAKFLYGFLLSSPQRRKVYLDILKAISKKDLPAYRKTITSLKSELDIEDKDDFEEFGFK